MQTKVSKILKTSGQLFTKNHPGQFRCWVRRRRQHQRCWTIFIILDVVTISRNHNSLENNSWINVIDWISIEINNKGTMLSKTNHLDCWFILS